MARPSPPAPPPAVAPEPRRRGGWRAPLIAAAILVLGGGAAAAIILGSGDDGDPAATVAAETTTTTPDVEPTDGAASSSPYPPVRRGEMKEEIESVLLTYHEAVVTRDFRTAWALLSPRKRQQNLAEYGYRKWKKAQRSLSDDLLPWGLQVRIDELEGEGVARVMLTGMVWTETSSSCSEWAGLTWVKYERGEWRYDPGYSTTPARRRTWKPRATELLGATC